MSTNRRAFLKLLSSSALTATFPASISRALGIPASNRTGTIADVEHIVILMQENRSFDHYFGTLRGVRGFGDPRAVTLPSGNPSGTSRMADGYVCPSIPARRILACSFSKTFRMTGRQRRGRGTTASMTSGSRSKGTDDDGAPRPQRYSLPLRAGRRLHHLRCLPLLAPWPDRSQPLLHVDRLGRQRWQRRRPGRGQRRRWLQLDHISGAACRCRHRLEDLSGRWRTD